MTGFLWFAADLPYAIGHDADARFPLVERRQMLACGEREEGLGDHTKTCPRLAHPRREHLDDLHASCEPDARVAVTRFVDPTAARRHMREHLPRPPTNWL